MVLALKDEDIVKSYCSLPLCGEAKVPEERLEKASVKVQPQSPWRPPCVGHVSTTGRLPRTAAPEKCNVFCEEQLTQSSRLGPSLLESRGS